MLRMTVTAAVGLLLAMPATPSRAALVLGQVDGFEDGTLRDWQNGGSRNPNPATNIPSGGPGGVGDHFLRITSNGLAGAGGKLVVFNGSQWAGDYLGAGVDAIRLQLNNTGATGLSMRLILIDALDGQNLTTSAPVDLPAGGGWTTVMFPLTPANLSGGAFGTVMGRVTELDLVHSPSLISDRSSAPNIAAQLGVDDVTAVPEPGAAGSAAAALAAVACLRRRRRAGPRGLA